MAYISPPASRWVFPVGVICWGGRLGTQRVALCCPSRCGGLGLSVSICPAQAVRCSSGPRSAPVRGMPRARPRGRCPRASRAHRAFASALVAPAQTVNGNAGCQRFIRLLRVYEEGFANLCMRRRVPAACSLPAPRCLPLHAYAWSRAAPPCRGPADPTGLPRETSLQQGAEKCP